MLLAPYADYEATALALSGTDAASTDTADLAQFRIQIEGRLREYWQHTWWPDTMRSEERAYRNDYASGTAYATGDEVYYATTGKYYSALQSTTGDLPTDDTYWEELTEIDPPEVAYEQEDQTAIGLVRLAAALDPLGAARPRRLPFQLTATGVRLICDPVPTTVYLWYQARPPELRGAAYAALSTYAVGDRIYFTSGTGDYRGDFWECVSATSAGQTPITHAAKWSRVELPRFLLEAVAAGVAADRMRSEGKFEAAALMEGRAMDLLVREHAKLDQMQLQDPGTLRSKAYAQRTAAVV